MIVTFAPPTSHAPVGGAISYYERANAMARRGHTVHVAHVDIGVFTPLAGPLVERLEDVSWQRFEPSVVHHFPRHPDDLPDADFIVSPLVGWDDPVTGVHQGLPEPLPASAGLPLLPIQGDIAGGSEVNPQYFAPCPKLCPSRWLHQCGLDLGVPPEQLLYLPNGIRHDLFRVRVPIADRPPVVAMPLYPLAWKGSEIGLEALTMVKARLPELRAVTFGINDPTVHLPDWVTHVQSVPQDELAARVYDRSGIFLQPSLEEGFGKAAVEAMACGCALVTTDNGGSDDYAVDGETALVVPPGDAGALAERVEALLRDEPRRTALATRGCGYVRRFDWDDSTGLLERLLGDYAADPDRLRRVVVAR
jgi:glycosyltransferase involved in cell wall biosynthesis